MLDAQQQWLHSKYGKILHVPFLTIHHRYAMYCCYPHVVNAQEQRVWWYLANSTGFVNVDYYFLGENIPSANHTAENASSTQWHNTCLACKLVISRQLCIQYAMNFLMKPKKSVTRSSQVRSGHKTTRLQLYYIRFANNIMSQYHSPSYHQLSHQQLNMHLAKPQAV